MVAAALGGEGGAVFTNWVIDVAEREGWLCQTTSLAGVAQRTGATIYYIELFPRKADREGSPVMSLFPAQGDIDIAIASEIAEAGRMVQRGFVTPDRTTLIASAHRVYGISEKIDLGDGIVDSEVIAGIAERYASEFIHFDMAAVAEANNSVISAVMLGALAGAQVLPFSKASFEATIEATGKAVATNLAAFSAGYEKAAARGVETWAPAVTNTAIDFFVLPGSTTVAGGALLERLTRDFPACVHEIFYHALERAVDYQDYAYASEFLDLMGRIHAMDDGFGDFQLTRETGRWLALWMCYEDVPRVAQLKIRLVRTEDIRKEVKAEPDQFIHVTEFFRPRVEEICAMLPAGLGQRIQDSAGMRRIIGWFTGGRQLKTTSLSVFLVLRLLASLRRFRRGMLGYRHERARILRWFSAVESAANLALAREIAACGGLIKGYGDTRQRTTTQLSVILNRVDADPAIAASAISALCAAALADDGGEEFNSALQLLTGSA